MASSTLSPSKLLLLLLLVASIVSLLSVANATTPLTITVVNKCEFTVWPAIQPNAGHEVLQRGGFALTPLAYRSFQAPPHHWTGRIWARTGCVKARGRFACATGDCGRKECGGAGGKAPATLAQLSFHGADDSSYNVSLVDGFIVPMTVTPHEGKGECPVVGCRADLLATCPAALQMKDPRRSGAVVGCKSGCEAFGTDELCCRNHYNSSQTWRASNYSEFFKHACPATVTYPYDTPLTHNCASPREMEITLCSGGSKQEFFFKMIIVGIYLPI